MSDLSLDQMDMDTIFLATIKNGALEELFQHHMQKVLENMFDPNTKPDAARSITITLKFTPNKDRSFANLDVKFATKLASTLPIETSVRLEAKGNRFVAREPQQTRLAFQEN